MKIVDRLLRKKKVMKFFWMPSYINDYSDTFYEVCYCIRDNKKYKRIIKPLTEKRSNNKKKTTNKLKRFVSRLILEVSSVSSS